MYCYPAKVEKVRLGPSLPNPVVQIATPTQIIGMYLCTINLRSLQVLSTGIDHLGF